MITHPAERHDGGFSLIEVIVSIVILGIVATAGLSLYVTSIKSVTSLQDRDVSITIANESLERIAARSIATTVGTGVSALYTGRSRSVVEAQWTANSTVGGVSTTYPVWDPTATASATPAIPLDRTVTRNGTVYTARSMIGICYQPIRGGDCVKVSGATTTATPAGYASLVRVIVVVTWNPGSGCSAASCRYEAITLLDPNTDLEWNTNV